MLDNLPPTINTSDDVADADLSATPTPSTAAAAEGGASSSGSHWHLHTPKFRFVDEEQGAGPLGTFYP